MLLGDGIRVQAIERDDLQLFTKWLNDPEVRSGLDLYIPLSMAQEERWFEGLKESPLEEHPLTIEIDTPEGWVMIGNVSLMSIDWRNRSAEIGIFIGEKKFWGRGHGGKAMLLMMKHGFESMNLNRIFLRVYENNTRAIHAYEKIGFVQEGKLRQAIFQDGSYHDALIMSLLCSEWKER